MWDQWWTWRIDDCRWTHPRDAMATRRTAWEMAKRWKGTATSVEAARAHAMERNAWKKEMTETRKAYAEHVQEARREKERKKKEKERQEKEKSRIERMERDKTKRTGPRVPEIYQLAMQKVERKPKIKQVKRIQWKAVLDAVKKRQDEKEEKLLEESKRWIGNVETLEQRVHDALANPVRLGD